MSNNEYENPEVYEAEYGFYKNDFNIFLGIKSNGKALDLACGTGRLSRSLAKSGLDVTALDESQPMIDFASQNSGNLSIKYLRGDIRSFKLNKHFELITLAGNSFQALLTHKDQVALLTCVKMHLKPDGIFVFNTRPPFSENLVTTDVFEYWHSFHDLRGTEVKVFGKQDYNKATQVITYHTKRVWPDHETLTIVSLKFTAPEDVFEMLDKSGFKITATYGNTDKSSSERKQGALCVMHEKTVSNINGKEYSIQRTHDFETFTHQKKKLQILLQSASLAIS